MVLIIRRDQDKGFLGGISFLLNCKVELTPEESELVKKYKAHKEKLFTVGRGEEEVPTLTIHDLVKGFTWKAKDITILLNNEAVVKEVCEQFKALVDVMASFGGEEVFEY